MNITNPFISIIVPNYNHYNYLTQRLESVLNQSHMIVEGVKTAFSIKKICEKFDIEMPICEAVFKVLYKDSDPEKEVDLLMTRNLKSE